MDTVFIHRLQSVLAHQTLPGLSAQLQLAPRHRKFVLPESGAIDASVLLLLYPQKDIWHLVFIRRPDYPGAHSGQISFPGGKQDPEDLNSEMTALRETEEEIGIPAERIKILGKLSRLYIPISHFLVHPYVGWLEEAPEFRPDKEEVRYILEVPLQDFFDPAIIREKSIITENGLLEIPFFAIHNEEIWGATAMIMNEFISLAKPIWG